jgi:hypothetical protein
MRDTLPDIDSTSSTNSERPGTDNACLVLISRVGHESSQQEPLCQGVDNTTTCGDPGVLRKHRVVPHRIVRAEPDEPAKEQVVVDLLDQQPLRTDGVKHLQQQGPQNILRRNREPPRGRVLLVESGAQGDSIPGPSACERHAEDDFRHPPLQPYIAEHPILNPFISTHVR